MYESEASGWLTLESYINNEHFTGMVIPTPGFFLVLASRLMYENKAYRWSITCTTLVSLLVFPFASSGRLAICTLQFVTPHPSRLCRWWTAQRSLFSFPSLFSFFSPRVYRSPTASLGPRTTFKSRMVPLDNSSLRCGLLCSSVFSYVLLSQYPPSRVSPFQYEMVCTVVGRWCSKVPVRVSFFEGQPDSLISISDSPLAVPRPFLLLPTFHPFFRCVVLCGSLLLLVVLAGLLPQVATFDHRFTESSLNFRTLLRFHSQYAKCQLSPSLLTWQSITVASLSIYVVVL